MTTPKTDPRDIAATHLHNARCAGAPCYDPATGLHAETPDAGDYARADLLLAALDEHADAEQQAYVDRVLAETGVVSMGPDPDGGFGIRVVLAYELAAKMTEAFRTLLDAHPTVVNYIEQTLAPAGGGQPYVFIVCKPGGKTPHQLRLEAEEERDRLRKLADGLIGNAFHLAENGLDDSRRGALREYATIAQAALGVGGDAVAAIAAEILSAPAGAGVCERCDQWESQPDTHQSCPRCGRPWTRRV